jgi:hypothetical protein
MLCAFGSAAIGQGTLSTTPALPIHTVRHEQPTKQELGLCFVVVVLARVWCAGLCWPAGEVVLVSVSKRFSLYKVESALSASSSINNTEKSRDSGIHPSPTIPSKLRPPRVVYLVPG